MEEDVTGLQNAQLRLTLEGNTTVGNTGPLEYTAPLTTSTPNVPFYPGYLTIRHLRNNTVGGPLQTGLNEIVADYLVFNVFFITGHWSLKVEAFLPGKEAKDNKYLFAFQLSQWLEGRL